MGRDLTKRRCLATIHDTVTDEKEGFELFWGQVIFHGAFIIHPVYREYKPYPSKSNEIQVFGASKSRF